MDVFPGDLVFMCATAEVSTLPIRVIGCCRAAGLSISQTADVPGFFTLAQAQTGVPPGFTEETAPERGSSQRATAVWRKMPCWCQRGSEVRVGRMEGWRSICPWEVLVYSVHCFWCECYYDTWLWVSSRFFFWLRKWATGDHLNVALIAYMLLRTTGLDLICSVLGAYAIMSSNSCFVRCAVWITRLLCKNITVQNNNLSHTLTHFALN